MVLSWYEPNTEAIDKVKEEVVEKYTEENKNFIDSIDKFEDFKRDIATLETSHRRIQHELEKEQNDEHWTLCEMEQWLLDKANAECGYCYLALLKVGCTLSKDIHDFIDEAKAHLSIQHFEETWQNQTDQYSEQPMLKKWNENNEM